MLTSAVALYFGHSNAVVWSLGLPRGEEQHEVYV